MIAQKWVDSCRAFKNGKLTHDDNNDRFIPGKSSPHFSLEYASG